MTDHGRFDARWVVATACSSDPGLSPEVAEALAARAWDHLVAIGDLDAPELSRRLMADDEDGTGAGASATNAVATAAVAYCESVDLEP